MQSFKSSKKSSTRLLKVRTSSAKYVLGGKHAVPEASEVSFLNNPLESFDYFYKFIIIGDPGVGKSTFLQRVTLKNPIDSEFETVTLPIAGTNQQVRA